MKVWLSDNDCHEDVIRAGYSEPCDKVAVAVRYDPNEGGLYPVCSRHARGKMLPLADLVALREREAAAQALRDAARLIEHCHRAGLTDRGTVLADLDEFAERIERGDVL